MGKTKEDKRLQDFIDRKAPGSTVEEIMNTRYEWSDEVKQMFPLWLCFYRKEPGRNRRTHVGYKLVSDGEKLGKKLYKEFKSKKTKEMNNYNLMVAYCGDPDCTGTIRRITKHRGFRKLVAAYYPTLEEMESEKPGWRYRFYKYKDFHQLYLFRKFYNPEFEDLMNRCEKIYPCKSSGQRRLF